MKKINLDKVLYHGLGHASLEDREEISLKRLESVLKSGAILSRDEQRKIFDLPPYVYQYQLKNGNEYVCVCKRKGKAKNIKWSEAFYEFVEGGVSLILDEKLLDELEIRKENFQDGEIQIKNKIPLDYIIGIAVDRSSDESTVKHGLKSAKRGISREERREYLKHTYNLAKEVRNCLDKNGFEHLKIYSLDDGKEITNVENVLNQIYPQEEYSI